MWFRARPGKTRRSLTAPTRVERLAIDERSYIEQFRGWGRGLRRAIGAWYDANPIGDLAFQVVKYRDRHGFTHRDVFRLAHPRATDAERAALYTWIARETVPESIDPNLRSSAHVRVRSTSSVSTQPRPRLSPTSLARRKV